MAAYNSFHENMKYGGPAAGSAIGTVNGVGFDVRGMEEVLVQLNVGTIVGAGTLDVKVQESDDDAATDPYTDVVGAVFSQKTIASDLATYIGRIIVNVDQIQPNGRKRWLRIVGVSATAAGDWGAGFVGGGLHDRPVVQDNPVEFNLDETAD